ncbi:Holliday junction resolvase [Candidatus Woesearchaeota archaeon]|nr:MAG: Holliday junction resolvase [Candidatus Woesearchaeota archaeon]
MANKQKGSAAERELIHMFWKTGKWTACRVAGSGSMRYPSPDIIANKNGINLAIECKKTSKNRQYFDAKEIESLLEYSKLAGARALVAIKFPKQPWKFLDASELLRTCENYVATKDLLELKGLEFRELVGERV